MNQGKGREKENIEMPRSTRGSKFSLPLRTSGAHKIEPKTMPEFLTARERQVAKLEIDLTQSSFETELKSGRSNEVFNEPKKSFADHVSEATRNLEKSVPDSTFSKPQSTRVSRDLSHILKGHQTAFNTPIVSPNSSFIKTARTFDGRDNTSVDNIDEGDVESLKRKLKNCEKDKSDLKRQISELEKLKIADRKRFKDEIERISGNSLSESERSKCENLEKELNKWVVEISRRDEIIAQLKAELENVEVPPRFNDSDSNNEMETMRKWISVLEADKDHYILMYSQSEEKVENKIEEISNLKKEIENLQSSLSRLNNDKESLESINVQLTKSLEAEKESKFSLEKKLEETRYKLESQTNHESSLGHCLESTKERVRELESMLAGFITAEERIKRERREEQTQFDIKFREFSIAKNNEIEDLKSQLKLSSNSMHSIDDSRVKDLEKRLACQRDVLKMYEAEISNLKSKSSATHKGQGDELKLVIEENKLLAKSHSEMEELLISCQKEISDLKQLTTPIHKERVIHKESEKSPNELNFELEVAECKLKEYEDAFFQQQGELEKVTYQLHTSAKQLAGYERMVKEREKEIFDLKSDLNHRENLISGLKIHEAQIVQLESKIADLLKEKDSHERVSAELNPVSKLEKGKSSHRRIGSMDYAIGRGKSDELEFNTFENFMIPRSQNQENQFAEPKSTLSNLFQSSVVLKDSVKGNLRH